KIIDPSNNVAAIKARELRLNNSDAAIANQYVPLKAAYLVIRHRLIPDREIARLWRRATSLKNVSDAALRALTKELRILPIDHSSISKLIDDYPGFDRYAKLLVYSVKA